MLLCLPGSNRVILPNSDRLHPNPFLQQAYAITLKAFNPNWEDREFYHRYS
jgi:hypothetical protein